MIATAAFSLPITKHFHSTPRAIKRCHNTHHHCHSSHSQSHCCSSVSYSKRHSTAQGSVFATYAATLHIDSQPFTSILDTGSADFAIAASAQCDCPIYYNTTQQHCAQQPQLLARYVEGNWTGVVCREDVRLGEVRIEDAVFAAMQTQSLMLDCTDPRYTQNAILGLAYQSLLGPPVYGKTLFQQLIQQQSMRDSQQQVRDVFALLCCGWERENSGIDPLANHAQGSFDIGGPVAAHYTAELVFTPTTQHLFYTVAMLDVQVNGKSVVSLNVTRQPTLNDDLIQPLNETINPFTSQPTSTLQSQRDKSHSMFDERLWRQRIEARERRAAQRAADVNEAARKERERKAGLEEETEDDSVELIEIRPIVKSVTEASSYLVPYADTIVDTGTSNVVFPPQLFDNILSHLKQSILPDTLNDSIWSGEQCLPLHSPLLQRMPTVSIILAGIDDELPFELELPPCRYFTPAPATECSNGMEGYSMAIQALEGEAIMLGTVLHEHYYTVYDNERSAVGFAPIKCKRRRQRCLTNPIRRRLDFAPFTIATTTTSQQYNHSTSPNVTTTALQSTNVPSQLPTPSSPHVSVVPSFQSFLLLFVFLLSLCVLSYVGFHAYKWMKRRREQHNNRREYEFIPEQA